MYTRRVELGAQRSSSRQQPGSPGHPGALSWPLALRSVGGRAVACEALEKVCASTRASLLCISQRREAIPLSSAPTAAPLRPRRARDSGYSRAHCAPESPRHGPPTRQAHQARCRRAPSPSTREAARVGVGAGRACRPDRRGLATAPWMLAEVSRRASGGNPPILWRGAPSNHRGAYRRGLPLERLGAGASPDGPERRDLEQAPDADGIPPRWASCDGRERRGVVEGALRL